MQLVAKLDDSTSRSVSVEIIKDNNMIETKVISFDDFIDILQGSTEASAEDIEIGKLPKGYYDGAINVRYEKSFRCTIVVPAGIFPVSYFETVYSIPFPTLVFNFQILKGKIIKSRCFALKDIEPKDDSIIYRYPFGNVYNNGNICWGINDLNNVNNLSDLDKTVALFYGVPTNNDLFSVGNSVLSNEPFVATLRGFYEHLNGKSKFPVDVLNPINLTLGEVK